MKCRICSNEIDKVSNDWWCKHSDNTCYCKAIMCVRIHRRLMRSKIRAIKHEY